MSALLAAFIPLPGQCQATEVSWRYWALGSQAAGIGCVSQGQAFEDGSGDRATSDLFVTGNLLVLLPADRLGECQMLVCKTVKPCSGSKLAVILPLQMSRKEV